MLLCQNFAQFNSTPYINTGSIYSDSSGNKFTFGQILGGYSSSKFSFNVPASTSIAKPYLLIKYDSSNNIIFYKTLITDTGDVKCAYYKNHVYLVFFAKFQFSY